MADLNNLPEIPSTPMDSSISCPLDCPNRPQNGISLVFFGKKSFHIDKFEMLILVFILIGPVNISLRDAWSDKLTFRESMERIGMIVLLVATLKKLPTEQISNYLSSVQLDKNQ